VSVDTLAVVCLRCSIREGNCVGVFHTGISMPKGLPLSTKKRSLSFSDFLLVLGIELLGSYC
jgi:hypothetical protein